MNKKLTNSEIFYTSEFLIKNLNQSKIRILSKYYNYSNFIVANFYNLENRIYLKLNYSSFEKLIELKTQTKKGKDLDELALNEIKKLSKKFKNLKKLKTKHLI